MSYAGAFLDVLDANLDAVVRGERDAIDEAVGRIARALSSGHRAYAYLQGHFMPGESAPDRTGNPPLFTLLTPEAAEDIEPGDVLLASFQYGVLTEFVETTMRARQRGAFVIAVCPHSDPGQIVRSHPSGLSVPDLADLTIDTHIPVGDAALAQTPDRPGCCPTSAVVQALVHWLLVVGVQENRVSSVE